MGDRARSPRLPRRAHRSGDAGRRHRAWRDKIAETIRASYRHAPSFDEAYEDVDDLLRVPTDRLGELNEAGIRKVAVALGLDPDKLVRQSDLGVGGTGTALLVALCDAVGANTYLTGDGAGEYLSKDAFAAVGIDVVDQRFAPPRYPQLAADFVPGLSVVDAVMNCGWRGTADLLGV